MENKSLLYKEKLAIENSLKNITLKNSLDESTKTIDILSNDINAKTLLEKINLRLEIIKLNKKVNEIIYNYLKKLNYDEKSEDYNKLFIMHRQDIENTFMCLGNSNKYEPKQKLNGTMVDCLNIESLKNYNKFLFEYIDSTIMHDPFDSLSISPNDCLWRAKIECSKLSCPNFDYILPKNYKNILEKYNRYNEIVLKLEKNNLPLSEDLEEGTIVDEEGQVHLF